MSRAVETKTKARSGKVHLNIEVDQDVRYILRVVALREKMQIKDWFPAFIRRSFPDVEVPDSYR